MKIHYNPKESESLELNLSAIGHLSEIRKWAMGFGIAGLGVLIVLLAAAIGNPFPWLPLLDNASASVRYLVSIVLVLILFWPGYFLIRFAIQSDRAITRRDSKLLSASLLDLKLYYRSVGLIIFLFISFFILSEVLIVNGNPL